MVIADVLSSLDEEIGRLNQVKALLLGGGTGIGNPRAVVKSADYSDKKPKKKRTISAEGRARIAAAQKARWAKQKKTAKKAA